jgi:membrane protein required for colicin V production
MVSYDLLMLVVLAGCTVFGAWKGMAWQLASLSSLVVSYMVALNFSDRVAPVIGAQGPWNRVVAMLILYCVTAIAIWMAFRIVAGVIDRVKLREFDRQLGALFGAAKGVLLCLVITFFAVSLSETARGMVRSSRSGHYMVVLLDRAHPLMPHDIHEVLGPYFHQLQQGLDPNARPDDGHSHASQESSGGLGLASGVRQPPDVPPDLQPKTSSGGILDRLFGGGDNSVPQPPRSDAPRISERPDPRRIPRLENQGANAPRSPGTDPPRNDAPPGGTGWDDVRRLLDGIRTLNDLGRDDGR